MFFAHNWPELTLLAPILGTKRAFIWPSDRCHGLAGLRYWQDLHPVAPVPGTTGLITCQYRDPVTSLCTACPDPGSTKQRLTHFGTCVWDPSSARHYDLCLGPVAGTGHRSRFLTNCPHSSVCYASRGPQPRSLSPLCPGRSKCRAGLHLLSPYRGQKPCPDEEKSIIIDIRAPLDQPRLVTRVFPVIIRPESCLIWPKYSLPWP